MGNEQMGNEMGNATPKSDFDAYRDQLSRLLDLVDEEGLASVDRDAIATGRRAAAADALAAG